MAIREVESIPCRRGGKANTFTKMAYNDIEEAFNKRISKFEFEGEYNYKTLASIAREQARRYFRSNIYVPTARKVKSTLAEEGFKEISVPWVGYDEGTNIIRIFSVKGDDRVHVYATIYFNTLDNFYEDLLIKAREDSNKREKVS